MLRLVALVLALACCPLDALAAPPPPAIPDTPAGHALKAWLDAFNSGDAARIKAFAARFWPDDPVERTIGFAKQTGGFDLLEVIPADRLHLRVRVQEKLSPTQAVGTIEVKDADPPTITRFNLRAIPPGMSAADMDIKIDAAARARILDGIAAKITEFYIYPEIGKKMIEAMRAHQKKGEYDAITDGMAFAELLTKQLQDVSHDKHLRVDCMPEVVPKDDPPLMAERPIDPEFRTFMERQNCGFEKVEHLPGNIGYVKLNFFGDPRVCGATATAAFGFLAHVDAIIFDLRENGGGDPRMVQYVASYLFGERTHLNDLWVRKTGKATEYWTKPELPGAKLAKLPAFVLTSSRTFSGGEEFTYDLKTLKRATIVGETTGGGAHPVSPHRVDDHFAIGVPFARPINPITKKDWEGTGVAPDVKAPADQALEVALKLAGEKLRKK
jgi:hypothetical protein